MSLKLLLNGYADELLKSWPTEPRLYIRGTTDLDRQVPLSLVDTYIDCNIPNPQYVAAVKDGQALHPGRFSRDGELIPGKLRSLLGEGYTVNLREVQRLVPFLAQVSRELQRETNYSNHISAIITPPGKQGLRHHWDQFTGIITQITGRKAWPLWRPVVDHPMSEYLSSPKMWTPDLQKHLETNPPDIEYVLEPGDTLVLPRGWVHNPYSVGGGTSFHLTFAIKERSWLWLAQKMMDLAITEATFRAEVPSSDFAPGREDHVQCARSMAINFLQQLDLTRVAELIRKASVSEGA